MADAWLQFFELARDPFAPARNPELLFQSGSRHVVVAGLVEEVLAGASPVVTLRADRGLGKTNLLRQVSARLRARGLLVVEFDATATPSRILSLLGDAVGMADCEAMTPDQVVQALGVRAGTSSMAILVDDADQLATPGFRMLALLRQSSALHGLDVRLVLVGAPGRWPGLDQPDLADLRRDCISHRALFPLREDECRPYLEHKFARAGGRLNRVLSKAAVVALGRASGGVPGRLDMLARSMLDAAYRRRRRRITLGMALPGMSPELSWTLPLTMVALRSPWLAACGMLLLAGTAGLGFVLRDDLANSLDLQATAHTFAAALSGLDTDDLEPEPPAFASFTNQVPRPFPPVAAAAARSVASAETAASPPTPVRPVAADTAEVTHPADRPGAANEGRGHLDAAERKAPRLLRDGSGLMLVAGASDTLPTLYSRVYRGLVPPPYSVLLAANQGPIRPGMLLVFPEPPTGWARR